jgi:hypothetical protein
MLSASVNPGDFLFIENLYPEPKKPVFPGQIAGSHGAGVVVKVGQHVTLEVGTVVAFSYYNAWAEYAAVPEEWLIPLPSDCPIEVVAQFVNPITAWDLLKDAAVQPGDWLVLTAGNSAVSTAANDRDLLNEIAGISGQPDFRVRIGGVHTLADFKTAINETLHHPESGKRLLKMSDLKEATWSVASLARRACPLTGRARVLARS